MDFKLTNMPGYAEFTALYDQYRIDSATVHFIYASNSGCDVNNAHTSELPMIGIVRDYSDTTAVGSVNGFQEYEDFQYHRLDKPFSVSLRPRLATAVYGAGAFTSYAEAPDKLWIDTASAGAVHYGLKFYVENPINGAGATRGRLYLWVTYHMSFRDAR